MNHRADMVRLPLERPDLLAAVDVAVRVSFINHSAAEAAIAEEEDLMIFGAIDPACIGCGCTEDDACPGGCSWVSLDPPICSACKA